MGGGEPWFLANPQALAGDMDCVCVCVWGQLDIVNYDLMIFMMRAGGRR